MTNPLHELPKGALITYVDEDGADQTFDPSPRFKVGDRFRDADKRMNGRTVEIVEVLGVQERETWVALDRALFGEVRYLYGPSRAARAESIRQKGTRYWVRSEQTGRRVTAKESTLQKRFIRIEGRQ